MVPFHDSTRADSTSAVLFHQPTAMHEVSRWQTTACNELGFSGLGTGTTDHSEPFHDSTRAR